MPNIASSPVVTIRKARPLPLWLQRPAEHPATPAAIFEVIGIPNSKQTPGTIANDTIYGMQPDLVLNDPLGANLPDKITTSAPGNVITWTKYPNKYNYVQPPSTAYSQATYTGGGYSVFCGPAHDTGVYSGRQPNILIGVGDSHWPDNSLRRFVYGCDRPYWEIAIHGSNYKDWKTAIHFGDVDPRAPDRAGWTLPATSANQWDTFYLLADQKMYQWNGSSWTLVPTVPSGSALPPLGPVGSWMRTTGTTNDNPVGSDGHLVWSKRQSNGTTWFDDGSGAWNTWEVLVIGNDRTQDFRWYRHYDGGPRGGHAYYSYQVWERDHLFLRLSGSTGFPIDAGVYDDTVAGNLITKQWVKYPQDTPDNPYIPARLRDIGLGEVQPGNARYKHPVTEDVWVTSNDALAVLRYATRAYELWSRNPGNPVAQNPFTICRPTAGPTAGKEYAFGRYHDTWWWVYTIGTDKSWHIISGSGITGRTDLLNPQSVQDTHYDGMLWIPDLQKTFYYTRSPNTPQPLITLQLTSLTSIDIQPVPVVGGKQFATFVSGEGMLNEWDYSPLYKGVICRIDDFSTDQGTALAPIGRTSIQFMRTG